MSDHSLKNKAILGVGWSAIDAFLGQGVTFIVGLVLARLLTPEEYGLVGIISIFITILLGVVDCGFSNALIREPKVTDDDYSTLFYFNMGISLLMFGLLYIIAPWIALFFERPQLVNLTRVMGLLLILQSFSIVQYTILSKNVDFKTKTKASLISSIVSGIIGISMAFAGYGVWALVAQQLSRQFLYSISLWCMNKWWPTLRFRIATFRYMWNFGWKLLLSGLLNNFWGELYKVIVSKCYTPVALGQYTRSEQLAALFSSNITSIVQRVSYPVLSQIQDDSERLVNGYRKVIRITMFVTAISMISMGAISDPLIYCLIGPQWHQAATFLPLICISLSLYPLHAINLNMIQIQGRTDVFLHIEIAKKIIAIFPLCLGAFIGLYWMLVGSIAVGVISFFLNSYYSGRYLGYTSWNQLKDVSPSYGVALIIAFAVYFWKYLPLSYWLILPIQIVVGVVVFFVLCETVKQPEYMEIKELVRKYLLNLKQYLIRYKTFRYLYKILWRG